MKRAPVSTIMTKNLVTLSVDDDLYKAEKLFKEHHIQHLPVVEDGHIIGMLDQSDLERISFLDSFDSREIKIDTVVYKLFTVAHLMNKNPIQINSTISIKSCAEIFIKNELHALTVVENELLVGIVTSTDLIQFMLNEYEREFA